MALLPVPPTRPSRQGDETLNTYRIRDWDRYFENASSRKLKRLDWVAIPNKTDGEGYTALVDHPDAAAHLGAWYAIVEAASKATPRGSLPGGFSHGIGGICRSLGRISRLPEKIFLEVIPRLLEIGSARRSPIESAIRHYVGRIRHYVGRIRHYVGREWDASRARCSSL